jgi:hypothetical protein
MKGWKAAFALKAVALHSFVGATSVFTLAVKASCSSELAQKFEAREH